MKLLAIDTSNETCSAALLIDRDLVQALSFAPRRHGELILGMMQRLLDQSGLELHQLDALAFGCGPGSFTGIRIATAVIQGAAFGAELPVVPVSTLAAMAQGQFRREGQRRLLTALDARMDEVYWGCYEIGARDLAEPCCAERVCAPEQVSWPGGEGWQGVGPGWGVYGETLTRRLGPALSGINPDAVCEAQDIARLAAADLASGRWVPAEQALPVYLRDQVTRPSQGSPQGRP
ncbi:tRNA (adenosine(37)-N6)-threonylcarbamoyltransferase complex dimerization subunit type 1 TsaB [Thermochromatium tepidum]|uniref:tRNA threonylcarbamoyladenosine biosynthesis protein TsaB n=1 Tax=Thermochromatium tepidum ATCC 43061 TaxID=316276 RepID=A0A6I6EDM3_THETI|nr:tRNA (adenosine(37)-N6)-threonylcarbamoyltransferase complex dimerization subunit type 1 TsaB [Thermochromatium tepidum]QGU33069.1 tRNA (adenosine(37)-N6)-threonylcarbamoyltransferase complex dimerization subunit type 1 TsaB [Thermochromatium tepidum ATCC 43061]